MEDFNSLLVIFNIIIGLIALYGAVTGKGPAFKNDYPKAMKEDANKMMRRFCWIVGPLLLATGILEYVGFDWAIWIGIAVIVPAVIVYTILFRKRFKKYL